MSIQIESDLKEILGQINQKLDNLQKGVTDLRIELTEVQENLQTFNEKVAGLSKRLDTTEFVNRVILVNLIIAILGGFAKLFGLVGNP